MLVDIVQATPRDRTTLELTFSDGTAGCVDVASLIRFTGVFEPLADARYFARVRVDPELGTVVWPNGADLDPSVLHDVALRSPCA